MRLATITNWAYGVTVVLTLASGTTMLLASTAQRHERAAVTLRYDLDQATSDVDEDVEQLGSLARQFAVDGNPADLLAYRQEAAALGSVEQRTRHVEDAGARPEELATLHEAMHWADRLQGPQQAAITARQHGDRAEAIALLFSPEYARELDRVQTDVQRFESAIDQRTDASLQDAMRSAKLWQVVAEITLGITGLLFLCVLYFIFRRRVLRPVITLSDVVSRLAAQDYEAIPPDYEQVDEIGDMAQALRVFRETGIERQRLEAERDADRTKRGLLSRMTQRMQSCDTIEDLQAVVQRFVPEVVPELAGRLYLFDAGRNAMVEASAWLDPVGSRPEFAPLACWALRRNAPHRPGGETIDVPCEHVERPGEVPLDTICLPLSGQNGMLGLLYFERHAASEIRVPDVYLRILAENIALALDNLRLRDALRELALADALTTLANRRQLDEVLARDLADAASSGDPISCVVADIDHFKRFNDEFGHDAGDAVLRAVGLTLKQSVRESNRVFRYGGEEFLILLAGMGTDEAAERAEAIRAAVEALSVRHEGSDLGTVTISLGVATAPVHCAADRLVQTADAALLRAKREGRNRVVVATDRADRLRA
jgi:diguanylate cyclase (GGDEF)-like protein